MQLQVSAIVSSMISFTRRLDTISFIIIIIIIIIIIHLAGLGLV